MKKLWWFLLSMLVVSLSLTAKAWGAKPDFQAATVTNPVSGEPHRTVVVPSTAIEVAPSLYYLGQARDVDGRLVEGYAFIHRKDREVKPAKPPKGGPACYGYLARGAKWKTVENYLVDPENIRGLTASFISANLALDISKWESAAVADILGTEGSGVVDGADTAAPDDKNEVYFADIADSNAIAITIVWGYFGGPPQTRALVEWDQVYDQFDYDWSSSGEAGKMDFENIATHELGHSVGMDDVYETACSEVTMYGYADYGETKKRDLAPADIKGVAELY